MKNAQRSRIKRLRQKARDGKATPEEIQEVQDYDATKSGRGRPPAPSPTDEPPPTENPPTDTPPEPPSDEAPAIEPELTPPPIPSIDLSKDEPARKRDSGGSSGDWRTKYGHGRGGGGREGTCLFFAQYWHAGLMRMAEEITESGGKPVYNPDTPESRAMIVLAVDGLLPQNVVLTPQIVAGVATTGLLAQRAMRDKELKRKRDTRNSAAFRPVDPPPPPPEPTLPSEMPAVKVAAKPVEPEPAPKPKLVIPNDDGKPVL